MKPRLARKAQAAPGIDPRDRRALRPGDLGEADPMTRGDLVLEQHRIVAGREEKKTVEPAEVAIDALGLLNRLDAIDRRRLAFVIAARLVLAAEMDVSMVVIVELRGEMRAGARAHAAGEGTAI